MQPNIHLSFDGRCAEAFNFYQQVLGGDIPFMLSYGDSPMAGDVPAEWRDRTLHACLQLGDRLVMGADAPPDGYEGVKGVCINLGVASPAEARRVFDALAAGGTVTMPLEKTFWSPSFGMLTDRFGIPWMVNSEQELQPCIE